MSTSSSKTKKVHYERGTKSGHRSRDSGIGSSSASDRASLGDWDKSPISYQQMQEQRNNVEVLQEALDAAHTTIRQLETENQKLNESLSQSNKENPQLRKEKSALLDELDELKTRLGAKGKHNRMETSPRNGTRTTPPRTSQPQIEQSRISASTSKARRGSVVYDTPLIFCSLLRAF